MNGKDWVREVSRPSYERVLDYTGLASPLLLTGIIADIHEVEAVRAEAPAKIILWEHQRDWLLKCWKRYQDGFGSYSWMSAADNTTLKPCTVDSIMGIPVEVAS